MEVVFICIIVLVVGAIALIGVYFLVRKLQKKQQIKTNGEDVMVTLPLPKPAPDATEDGMDTTQVEGMDYRKKAKNSPNASDGKSLVIEGDKLVDPSKEDGSVSSYSSIKINEEAAIIKENEVCSERSDRPQDKAIPVINNNNKDKILLMFEAPPPYEESSKTQPGTTRMVPINMAEVDNTQATNTSHSSTPAPRTAESIKGAPQSSNLPKRLIPSSLSPNKFAGPRGETAVPDKRSSNAAETDVTFPPASAKSPTAMTLTSMCRSEMDVGINGENAGRTPRVNSPLTSGGGSQGTTNASTVVTFTPGSSTNEKEAKRY